MWRLVAQCHPHWRIDMTSSPAAARRYLDDHSVDALIAPLTALDAGMAAVLEAARAGHPEVRRIAVIDCGMRSHPEAQHANAMIEAAAPATLLFLLDATLAHA
ncbi:MAG: hypothetical protein JW751_03045 [Polyangiaceae bacterium]|nr:hypothetical protein [Polyangiaceae bacterium]